MRRKYDQSRPRMRLTIGPGGVMYFVVTALILAVAIYAQANLLFWSFGLMVGGLVVSIALSILMMRGLTVQRVLPSHGVAGEAAILRYQIVNHKPWVPAFGVVVCETWGKGRHGWRKSGPLAEAPQRLRGLPQGWVLHLGPRQAVQAEAPCWPLRRGQLKFEKIQLYTSFPFGVIRPVLEWEQPGQMLVLPHLYRINRRVLYRLSDFDPAGRKRLERAGGHEDFLGLREYRPGDTLRMIDWKSSAKVGKLVSREMTQPSPPRIMLLLDLSAQGAGVVADADAAPGNGRAKPKARATRSREKSQSDGLALDPVERAISLAASVLCDAHFHGYQIGMAIAGVPCTPFPVHHSLPHRTKMLEALAQLDTLRRCGDKQLMPARPSVVVRPGAGGPAGSSSTNTQMVLGAAEMEEYVSESDGGSSAILTHRAAPLTRRQEMQENATWA